jgi:hypothetical protein
MSVAEWKQICPLLAQSEAARGLCETKLFRPVARGRAIAAYEPVAPADQQTLLTRSGVFLAPSLNAIIDSIPEDSGLRTTIRLLDGVVCQSYSAALHLVGIPTQGLGYRNLVRDWLSVYTDAQSHINEVRVTRRNGRQSLQFAAMTTDDRVIRGTYASDETAHAGIFSTCARSSASAQADQHIETFFDSVVGSARRFID